MEIVEIDGKLFKRIKVNNNEVCSGCYFETKSCYHITEFSCDNSIFVELDKYEELFYKKESD